jgi:hypothetical protein
MILDADQVIDDVVSRCVLGSHGIPLTLALMCYAVHPNGG